MQNLALWIDTLADDVQDAIDADFGFDDDTDVDQFSLPVVDRW
jgi:hypothetical protein